jgi:hypothetical protein
MQDRQEIKEGTKFKKELRIPKIFGINGGFSTGLEKREACHRIPHKGARGRGAESPLHPLF